MKSSRLLLFGSLALALQAGWVFGAGANVNVANPASRPVPVRQVGTLPVGATALAASSGNMANSTASANLVRTAITTTYITGFQITASGATAALVVNATVTGTVGGTITYTFVFPAGVTTAAQPLIVTFVPPIPAIAVNTNITVTLPASGAGGTNATVTAQGFML